MKKTSSSALTEFGRQGFTSRPKAVIRELSAALKFLKAHPDAAKKAGERFFALELADAHRALAGNPKDSAAWVKAAKNLRLLGQPRAAARACTRALQLNPRFYGALLVRLQSRLDLGDLAGARADGRRATRLARRSADAWIEVGNAFDASRQWQKAIDAYTYALRLRPDDLIALYNRGATRRRAKRYREAIADFTRVLKREPEDTEALTNRGLARGEAGNHEGAVEDLRKAAMEAPLSAWGWLRLGQALKAAKQPARRELERALHLAKRGTEAWNCAQKELKAGAKR